MDRKLKAARRKIRAMHEGLNELIAAVNSKQPDWFESAFFNWAMNALLNVKYEIESTGIVRRRHDYPYLVDFDEETKRISFPIKVTSSELLENKRVIDIVTGWFQTCMELSLFRHLTHGFVVKFLSDSQIRVHASAFVEEAKSLNQAERDELLRNACVPFEWKGDGYLLKIHSLQYPVPDSSEENAAYLCEVLPYFLAKIDFPRVPIQEWRDAEIKAWESAWKRKLLPLDKARISTWKELTWSVEFLKKVEAADAIESTDEIKQIVLEEWNRDLKTTGRQYIEVPFSEEVDNEELIRKVRGRAHACIGAELEGDEPNESIAPRRRLSEEFVLLLRKNPFLHHEEITQHTGRSKSWIFGRFKPAPGNPGCFTSSSILKHYGYEPESE